MSNPFQQTEEFLRALYADTEGNVEIRACANDIGGGARPMFSRDMDEIRIFVKRWNKDGMGVYAGVSTRRIGSPTGSRRDLCQTPAVWVDIDARKLGLSFGDVIQALETAPLRPSILVDSGNGIHGYWLLKEPLTVDTEADDAFENEERIVAVLKQLAGVFAGDIKCCELARILRLPGTLNSKEMAKAANGGQPIPCRILWCVGTHRYDLEEVEEWLEIQRPLLEGATTYISQKEIEQDPYIKYARLVGARIPVDVERSLKEMSYGAEGDRSIHQTQLRVSGNMVARGASDDEIVGTLMPATQAAAGLIGASWNWRREEKKIRRMVEGARKLGFDEKAKQAAAATGPAHDGGAPPADEPAAGGTGDAAPLPSPAPERAARPAADHGDQGGAGSTAQAVATLALETQAAHSDIEEVAEAVLAKWRDEKGPLAVVRGEFWTYDGGIWKPFDETLDHELKVEINAMSRALNKKPTKSFKTNVYGIIHEDRRLSLDIEFGNSPWLACEDGAINPRTGEVKDLAPELHCTVRVPARLQGDPSIAKWMAYLQGIFEDRSADETQHAIDLIQEWFGAALVRGKPKTLSKALIFHGLANTGKTRLANVATLLMGGKDRVASLKLKQLEEKFGLQGLIGRTAWIRDDGIGPNDNLEAENFKTLVSGERLSIQRKNVTDLQLALDMPVMFTCNNLPRNDDPTDAVYNRLLLVPMMVVRAGGNEADSQRMDAEHAAELPGILRWAIAGWQRLAKRGWYDIPAFCKAATQQFKDQNAPVQTWLKECVEADPQYRVHRADMLASLNAWANEEHGGTKSQYGAKTMNRHILAVMPQVDTRDMSHGERYVRGVKLNEAGLASWKKRAMVTTGDQERRPFSDSADSVNRKLPRL